MKKRIERVTVCWSFQLQYLLKSFVAVINTRIWGTTLVFHTGRHADHRLKCPLLFSDFNPLKMKRIGFIQGLSAYRAVNTLHFGYKNQSLNVL
jgi:hypothetical protein